MRWDHKVRDVGLESGARFDDFGPGGDKGGGVGFPSVFEGVYE